MTDPERTPGGAPPERSAGGAVAPGSRSAGGEVGTLGMLLAAIAGVRDPAPLARLIVSALPSLVPCDLVALALRADDEEEWTTVAERGGRAAGPELQGALTSRLEELRRAVVARGRLEAPDPAGTTGTGAPPPSVCEALDVGSLVVLPVRTVRSFFGLLLAGRDRDPPGRFARSEDAMLEVVSGQLATAIDNLRLRRSLEVYSEDLGRLVSERTEELDRSRRRLQAVLDINNAVVTSLDRTALFGRIAEALARVIGFDRAMLTLFDPSKGTVRVAAVLPERLADPPAEGDTEVPVAAFHLRRVLEDLEPRIRRDLRSEERVGAENSLLAQGVRSYVAVPMAAKGRPVGTLSVGSFQPGRYAPDDATFLLQVAKQIALAIDNMLAYEEIRDLTRKLELETEYLREEVLEARAFGEILGRSPAIREIGRRIEQVAPTGATVLVMGESGTGKELVAREIHRRSRRADGPLIKVNCAAVPKELYESEFFGHVKGAFTGAIRDRAGRFAAADRGTLLLDEVGEIPLELQGKLLRVLQEGRYERVGEERTRSVDVRVVAATNRNLPEEVRAGRFREDLFYRLDVFPVLVPPLRERREDVALLAAHFLERAARELGRPGLRLTQGNVAELTLYDWPGNVRELQNAIERAVITARSGTLRFDLPGVAASTPPPASAAGGPQDEDVVPEVEMRRRERRNLERALERSGGKVYGNGGAAELLGIPPTTLASRIRSLGIDQSR